MRLLLLVFFAAMLLPGIGRGQQAEPMKLASIAPIVETEIAAGRVPGAVVLVGQGKRLLYAGAFGRRAVVPAEEPMTLDTIFDLASLTKVVATTTSVMRLVEQGRIALDTPAARYWPAFAAGGKGTITVRQLLAHTSGLPAGIDLGGAKGPPNVLKRVAEVRPVAKPGGAPLYSDVNFVVLGELVRRVSGLRLDDYTVRNIFKPLGMNDTGFLPPATRRGRIAPTLERDGTLLRGQVQDPLATNLGGVSGNAGLFSTAADLARFARALLAGGGRVLRPATVAQMLSPQTDPAAAQRGLGWRLEAPLAVNRAALPPVGSASHVGFTGTGLWLDRVNNAYVIILSSRLHPNGRGDAGPLRAKVVEAVAEALGDVPPQRIAEVRPDLAARIVPYVPKPVAAPVHTGIDVLEAKDFEPLRGLRIGLLTHRSGVDSSGRRTVDVLAKAPGVKLVTLFSPEHGLSGDYDGRVADDTDLRTGLPIVSLYGETKRPTPAMLKGLDAVVVDMQDVGTRYYTYASTLAYLLEAAAGKNDLQVFVLDRPDPLNGAAVQGPLLDEDLRSFTGYWPLPVRPGLTLGEFARLFNAEAKVGARLTVIPMDGYRRDLWYDDTGLPWLPPSPNLTSLGAATLYPALGMIEGTEVSVGRGTDTPFEVIGAPWADGQRLVAELDGLHLAGLRFAPVDFTPAAAPYAGERCHGVRIAVIDRDAADMAELGIALAATLDRLHPAHFTLDKALGSIGSRTTLDAIRAGRSPAELAAGWQADLAAFRTARARYLLYP